MEHKWGEDSRYLSDSTIKSSTVTALRMRTPEHTDVHAHTPHLPSREDWQGWRGVGPWYNSRPLSPIDKVDKGAHAHCSVLRPGLMPFDHDYERTT